MPHGHLSQRPHRPFAAPPEFALRLAPCFWPDQEPRPFASRLRPADSGHHGLDCEPVGRNSRLQSPNDGPSRSRTGPVAQECVHVSR